MTTSIYHIRQTIFGHDGVNTFNTIDRSAGADSLRSCPVTADLFPAYRLKYGNNRTLIYDQSTSSFTVDGNNVCSCVGPQQDDTWGTLLCCTTHQRSFSLAQIRNPSSTLIGFSDDGHFANPIDTSAYSTLLFFHFDLTHRVGVTPNDKGGCISLPSDLAFVPASFPGSPHHRNLKPSNFASLPTQSLAASSVTPYALVVSQALKDRTIDLLVPLDNICYLHDTGKLKNSLPTAERLISDCACASTTHLQAMHPPSVFLAAAIAHDILILHAAALCYQPPHQSTLADDECLLCDCERMMVVGLSVQFTMARMLGTDIGVEEGLQPGDTVSKTGWGGIECVDGTWREIGDDLVIKLPDGRKVPRVPGWYKHVGFIYELLHGWRMQRQRALTQCRTVIAAITRLGVLGAEHCIEIMDTATISVISYHGSACPLGRRTCDMIDVAKRRGMAILGHRGMRTSRWLMHAPKP